MKTYHRIFLFLQKASSIFFPFWVLTHLCRLVSRLSKRRSIVCSNKRTTFQKIALNCWHLCHNSFKSLRFGAFQSQKCTAPPPFRNNQRIPIHHLGEKPQVPVGSCLRTIPRWLCGCGHQFFINSSHREVTTFPAQPWASRCVVGLEGWLMAHRWCPFFFLSFPLFFITPQSTDFCNGTSSF